MVDKPTDYDSYREDTEITERRNELYAGVSLESI
jgi:hypothetical protein